jgi:hypothetical protein
MHDQAARGPLRSGLWRWLAAGSFAAIAVVSAIGYSSGGSEPLVDHRAQRYLGEEILGTRGTDDLRGGAAGELLYSFGGPDTVFGGEGNDLIDPGNSADTVYAGGGDDRIRAFDDVSDKVYCGAGHDLAYVDVSDRVYSCEETFDYEDMSLPATPDPPADTTIAGRGVHYGLGPRPLVTGTVVLEDRSWRCEGPVDVDLVKVTIHRRSSPLDAISLARNCTGRIGRIEVDQWSGDGIKVQNAGAVAHDVVIESGYVRCYEKTGAYHQDGIQAMGGRNITFRNLHVDCGRLGVNANLFIAQGGSDSTLPTDVVFEGGRLGPNAAHTILLADAVRSGVRNTLICTGRWFTYMKQKSAVAPVDEGNTIGRTRAARCA